MTPPGVTFLDHTADVGMDVEAPSLEELLHRSALGMLALLRGEEETGDEPVTGSGSGAPEPRPLSLRAGSAPELLAAWLRELLFLHEVERRDYEGLEARVLEPWEVEGDVRVRPGGRAVREIKGVTYHALAVERTPDGWRARVIFDV